MAAVGEFNDRHQLVRTLERFEGGGGGCARMNWSIFFNNERRLLAWQISTAVMPDLLALLALAPLSRNSQARKSLSPSQAAARNESSKIERADLRHTQSERASERAGVPGRTVQRCLRNSLARWKEVQTKDLAANIDGIYIESTRKNDESVSEWVRE